MPDDLRGGVYAVGLQADDDEWYATFFVRPSFHARASFIFEGIADREVIGDFGILNGGLSEQQTLCYARMTDRVFRGLPLSFGGRPFQVSAMTYRC